MMYAYSENFVLPLSHDEVVHGKGSLLGRMPGDDWQRRAGLRLLLGYMWATPGKKLLFMGGEIGQWAEWNHDASLDWQLLQYEEHAGIQRWVADLNRLYRGAGALHERDCEPAGFEWVDCNDSDHSLLGLIRRGWRADDEVLVVLNFTPQPRVDYRVGVPRGGYWKEVLNSDAAEYGGGGWGNYGGVEASAEGMHGRPFSLKVTLPPLAALFFSPSASPPASP
jgi:1,4-alpha-glucan branching enzyme